MVVEVVATATGADRYRRAVRRLGVVVAVLTVGQLFIWDNQDAHRSMFSFVMSMIWLCTTLVLAGMTIAGPDEEPDDEVAGEGAL
ncbi:hypothetical protein [Kocuria rhizosphaericola]|uniref:hypothetical protein n=1 Tax=Kocuria rhizosphaericola TaxID=3376284 RepID=UPI003787D7E4